MGTDTQSRRFVSDPTDESGDIRMLEQFVDGVIGCGELPLAQDAVDQLVTGAAEQGETAGKFGFVKVAPGLSFPMTGPWNQVMTGEFDFSALAELATAFGHANLILQNTFGFEKSVCRLMTCGPFSFEVMPKPVRIA